MDLDFPPDDPKELEELSKELDSQRETMIQQMKAQEQAGDPAGMFQRAVDEDRVHELEQYQTPHQPRTAVPADNYEDETEMAVDHQRSQSRPYNRVHLNHRYWIWAPDDFTNEVVQTKASQLHRELAARHYVWNFRTSEVTHTVMGEQNDFTVRRITVMVAKEIRGLNGKSLNVRVADQNGKIFIHDDHYLPYSFRLGGSIIDKESRVLHSQRIEHFFKANQVKIKHYKYWQITENAMKIELYFDNAQNLRKALQFSQNGFVFPQSGYRSPALYCIRPESQRRAS
ncbi:hypothetical protein MIR68_003113 [Amoeboaphelidium protococcarum]|nr:hypothetical protein MIR68_003113 [Amoeboaphelidium protococcarum]